MNTLKLEEDFNIPSPWTKLNLPEYPSTKLFIKRDDLIHPVLSGNKWRKLKYALQYFQANNFSNLVTFGGPFSNHILATAIATFNLKIKSHAFIRTDQLDMNNPTLRLCQKYGMSLYAMSREDYKIKSNKNITKQIETQIENCLIIPEGGSSQWAIAGMQEMIEEIEIQSNDKIDRYFCSLGTAATAVGIASSISRNTKLTITPAIKAYSLDNFYENYHQLTSTRLQYDNVNISYHPLDRAYAKKDKILFHFAEEFLVKYNILLDPIYTVKVMRSILLYLKENQKSENLCMIHSGGLQAWNGYFYRSPQLKEAFPNIFRYMLHFNKALGLE